MNINLCIFSWKRGGLLAGEAYTEYIIQHTKENTGLPPMSLVEFSKKYNSSFSYMRIATTY